MVRSVRQVWGSRSRGLLRLEPGVGPPSSSFYSSSEAHRGRSVCSSQVKSSRGLLSLSLREFAPLISWSRSHRAIEAKSEGFRKKLVDSTGLHNVSSCPRFIQVKRSSFRRLKSQISRSSTKSPSPSEQRKPCAAGFEKSSVQGASRAHTQHHNWCVCRDPRISICRVPTDPRSKIKDASSQDYNEQEVQSVGVVHRLGTRQASRIRM